MKVLILSEVYHRGGLESQIQELASVLVEQGFQVSLLINESNKPWSFDSDILRTNIRVITYRPVLTPNIAKSPLRKFVLSFAVKILELPFLSVIRGIQLRKSLGGEIFDTLVVANGGYPGGAYCLAGAGWLRKNRKRTVMWVHGMFSRDQLKYSPVWAKLWLARISKTCDFVAPSIAVAKTVTSALPGTSCTVISNLVRRIPMAESASDQNSRANLILCASAYLPNKGQEDLISAVEILRDRGSVVQVRFNGDGDVQNLASLKQLVESKELTRQIKFGGFIEDKSHLYAGIDLLVLPSKSNEAFGLVLVEAMSLGIPIIGAAVGGIPEVIGGENLPVTYNPGDTLALANLIEKFFSDAEFYNVWSDYGLRRFSTNFSEHVFQARVNALLSSGGA